MFHFVAHRTRKLLRRSPDSPTTDLCTHFSLTASTGKLYPLVSIRVSILGFHDTLAVSTQQAADSQAVSPSSSK